MLNLASLLLAVLLIIHVPTLGQNTRISGKVVSSQKSPLGGVTVQVKNSKISTATSEDGSFSINAPSAGKNVLIFSSIGFKTQELSATPGSAVELQLTEEAKGLTDVVVVGYGTVKKTDL